MVCTYSIAVNVDITNLKGQKLYPAMIWLLIKTVNDMPEFRTCLTSEGIGIYDDTLINQEMIRKTFSFPGSNLGRAGMIYRIEDFRMTKPMHEPAMAHCMIHGAGVFGDEIYAAEVSFAMQQVYDRFYVWVRLTRDEYDAFPGNRDILRPLMEESSRILLRHGGLYKDIAAFDSTLPGSDVKEMKR